MKIRAITIGQIIPFLLKDETIEGFMEQKLELFSQFNEDLIENFKDINLEVQTKRLCSQPLFDYDDKSFYEKNLGETLLELYNHIGILQKMIKKHQIDYFASCTMLADHIIDRFGPFERLFLNEVPKFLKEYDNFFTSLPVASTERGINFSALKSGAKIIKELSKPDPFNNLQFCVSSNIDPSSNTPFFPASYHFADNPKFSLALEMADEVVNVFDTVNDFMEAKEKLTKRFNDIYDVLTNISESVGKKYGLEFGGLDFSPAPYPAPEKSIGAAIEKLGFEYFGSYGNLLGISLIKSCIPKHREKVIGFSGFMQPVLEDYVIGQRLSENKFNLDTLFLFSTICGTGLDCVPLPGDVSIKELFYILLDLCTISISLNKPLTARLLPMPGKKVGDDIEFDFEYFVKSSKVINIKRLSNLTGNDLFERNEKYFKFT